jgi:hypothetical protein
MGKARTISTGSHGRFSPPYRQRFRQRQDASFSSKRISTFQTIIFLHLAKAYGIYQENGCRVVQTDASVTSPYFLKTRLHRNMSSNLLPVADQSIHRRIVEIITGALVSRFCPPTRSYLPTRQFTRIIISNLGWIMHRQPDFGNKMPACERR